MTLTATQITQLNNSMEAAQRIGLGTLLNDVLNDLIDSGSVVPTSARHVIVTDLTDVEYAVVSLSGSPTLEHSMSTATAGSAGYASNVILNQWTFSGSTTDVAASSGSTSDVYQTVTWIAVGS